MKNRKTRLKAIVDIVTSSSIGSQEELSRLLSAMGHVVTQATLSRDLKMLRTTKVPTDSGGYRYVVAPSVGEAAAGDVVQPDAQTRAAVLSVTFSGNMAVIKTRNGYASGLAYDMDMLGSRHIVGTIAGADTVMAVLNEASSRGEVMGFFSTILPPEVVERAAESGGGQTAAPA